MVDIQTSLLEEFVPSIPKRTTGKAVFVSQKQLELACREQGGRVGQIVFRDVQYLIPNKQWLLTEALPNYRQLQEHLFNLTLQHVYDTTIYECDRFAISFYMFLLQCQQVYWSKYMPNSSLAVGWGYSGGPKAQTTQMQHQYGVSLAAFSPKGSRDVKIWTMEAQKTSSSAKYGQYGLQSLWFMHF